MSYTYRFVLLVNFYAIRYGDTVEQSTSTFNFPLSIRANDFGKSRPAQCMGRRLLYHSSFLSQEFQAWRCERGITHLTGAPYHPATNGAAERLITMFKHGLVKSSFPPKTDLQEFLMQYIRHSAQDTHPVNSS